MFDLFPSIKPFADALVWTLSGGKLQIVAVGRGLMAKPRLLLLDEPSLGLAPVVMQAVFQTESLSLRDLSTLLFLAGTSYGLHEARRGYERRLDLDLDHGAMDEYV